MMAQPWTHITGQAPRLRARGRVLRPGCRLVVQPAANLRRSWSGYVPALPLFGAGFGPARRHVGVNLHKPCAIQQESAQINGLGFQGLTAASVPCIVTQAAQPRCCAEHLFRPLRLNGQVRAPIRGLPVFYPLQAPAEACRIPPQCGKPPPN